MLRQNGRRPHRHRVHHLRTKLLLSAAKKAAPPTARRDDPREDQGDDSMDSRELPERLEEFEPIWSDYLGQCQAAVAECFRRGRDEVHSHEFRIKYYLTAAKVMQVSLGIAERLKPQSKDFTHRIIVERVAPAAVGLLPPAEATPPEQN
jgi:hypothetical protein